MTPPDFIIAHCTDSEKKDLSGCSSFKKHVFTPLLSTELLRVVEAEYEIQYIGVTLVHMQELEERGIPSYGD